MVLGKLFYYIVLLSLMGSILAIGLLILKKLFGQKLGANFHYYIWFVLILRLIIPFTPSVSFNVLNYIPHFHQAVELPQISISGYQQKENPTAVTQKDGNNLNTGQKTLTGNEKVVQEPPIMSSMKLLSWKTFAEIWMTGGIAIFIYILLVNLMLLLRVNKLPVCESEDVLMILKECQSILNVRSRVFVVYNDTLKSPALLGLIHPRIIISPEIIENLSPEELRYIFLHELSHLKRSDLFVNSFVLAIQVIYWFNPVIWLSLFRMKQDCEIACDSKVLSVITPKEYKKYGQTIISLLQLLSEPHWALGTLGFVSKFNTRRITMISKFRKTTFKWAIMAIGLTLTLAVGCSSLKSVNSANNGQSQSSTDTNSQQNTNTSTPGTAGSSSTDSNTVIYNDTQLGFSFKLPEDWKGYSIVNTQWQGLASNAQSGDTVVESGPIISIRDPRWTSKTPRQDIPIMVFTLDQWNSLQQGVFHIGAAPIGPSELGRNNSYVFALPARYNYAFPAGYQEVDQILQGKPLQTTQTAELHPDSTESLLFDMMVSGAQGEVLFCDFPVKTTTIEDIQKVWGKADKTDYVPAADGSYATYGSHNVVFGINKGEQIFEVRSFDSRLKGITIENAKRVLGTPAYDAKGSSQEVIGYATKSGYKVEMVFPKPTSSDPNPVIDHYNVLYPQGTANNMAGTSGRQW